MIAKNRAQLKAWIKNMSAKVEVNEDISYEDTIKVLEEIVKVMK